ncbi:nucleotidyl transferase AbiEii/AbiGii toxin family protein [Candidatus Roizmanbacteria bacterium]|nr:nucleotidyl transferase AbiEii/AbiGii toxin family protein [Candidatus Roizmanbacteria bacterium]
MGKSILTPKQLKFLECIQEEKSITRNFYLTGGTALAEFYLLHRLSEDIDLFSEHKEVDPGAVDAFLRKISPKLKIKNIQRIQFLGLFTYILNFRDNDRLKVDFNYYPFPRIKKGTLYKSIQVDSIHDIAANKIHTLFMKPRARDYVDLYYILKNKDLSIEKLILDAKAKFDWHIDPLTLASQFMRVKEFTDMPQILVPFNENSMKDFFVSEAKKLKNKIIA